MPLEDLTITHYKNPMIGYRPLLALSTLLRQVSRAVNLVTSFLIVTKVH